MNKPFSESCIQNQQPILQIIQNYFKLSGDVLEIGSGTGQHAVFFAEQCAHLNWHPSDVEAHLSGIQMWLNESQASNLKPAIAFNINQPEQYPKRLFNYMFSANTVHIMSWAEVELLFLFIGSHLEKGGVFLNYGPFNYNGNYTSQSNKNFDVWLRQLAGDSAIKHFEAIEKLANTHGLKLLEDCTMPANNRILVWQKN